jgi:hypothetical protein
MTVDGLKTIRASLRVVSSVIVFGLTFFVLLSQNDGPSWIESNANARSPC